MGQTPLDLSSAGQSGWSLGGRMTEPQIRLLGSVQVEREGQLVHLGGRRARTLITLLSLEGGRTVSIDRLTRGMWDDQPPERIRGSLQTYVSRLRRALGEGAVTTEPTGYALRIPRRCVDVLRFRDAAINAQRASSTEEEQHWLDLALAEWSGEPFGEELSSWLDRSERPRLIEQHLQVLERRLDLDLDRGDYTVCALRVGALVEEHPLRETLWVLLLRALDAAGRTAEALERYETIRVLLATELGADPSPELQRMHQQLLAPSLPPPAELPAPTVPRQMPAATAAFTGRRDELARLTELGTNAGSVIAVHGPGGAGKTSLVLHWAQQMTENFPDGQLFADLRGFGPGEAVPPAVAVDLLLRGLGVAGTDIPDELDARTALLRSGLAERRCLIVLDNAGNADQVRPLIPGGPSVVVVTSRRQLRSLTVREGAVSMRLGQMSESEAVLLLRHQLVTADGTAESAEAQLTELASLCGYLPVALSIVAEKVGRHPEGPTETLAELRESENRLDVLATGEDEITDVRAVLEWTFRELDEDAAHMFAVLGLYPDGPLCSLAVTALSGLTFPQSRARLDRLAGYHLLDPLPDGWYAIHDLVSAFATELAERELPAADREDAVRRLRSWFLHTAQNALYAIRGIRTMFRAPPPAPGVEPRDFEDKAQAQLWFSRHRAAIRTLLAEAERDGDHGTVCGLVSVISVSLENIGARAEARLLGERGLASAQRSGDQHILGVMTNLVGVGAALDGEYERAQSLFERALTFFVTCEDWLSWRLVTSNVSDCHSTAGRHQQAVELKEKAHLKIERVGLPPEELGWSLSQLADTRIKAGDLERGLAEAEHAIELLRETGGMRLAAAYETVAGGLAHLHRWSEAEQAIKLSVTGLEACGAFDQMLRTQVSFAQSHGAEGNAAAAKDTLESILEQIERLEAAGDYEDARLHAMVKERLEGLRVGSDQPGLGTTVPTAPPDTNQHQELTPAREAPEVLGSLQSTLPRAADRPRSVR